VRSPRLPPFEGAVYLFVLHAYTRSDEGLSTGAKPGVCSGILAVGEGFENLHKDAMIMRMKALTVGLLMALTACGGSDTADEGPPSATPSAPASQPPSTAAAPEAFGMPDWMQVDEGARTVRIEIVAGLTEENNRWNFNGYFGGTGGITVPVGYTVTIAFENQDPAMAHSLGVDEKAATYPNLFDEVVPVFEGGVTADPTSMMDATMPGEAEEIVFVADEAGEYVLLCYVTGHAAIGMWLDFSADVGWNRSGLSGCESVGSRSAPPGMGRLSPSLRPPASCEEMGKAIEHPDLSPAAIRAFTSSILTDLRALEQMLKEGWIEEGVRRIGAEQEMFLVREDWRPSPSAMAVLERLGGPPFTTELALFNLEANLEPIGLSDRCFTELHDALDRAIGEVAAAAEPEGARVVLAGNLPTLVKSDLALDQITPVPRYYTLNEALTRLRRGKYQLQMEGADELMLEHDSVMLEACNASCQVHLQVGVEEFPRLYNTAQLMVAPVLAASVNSPLLFGRRLWAETRIALFQQSLDTRAGTPYLRDLSTRVRFGNRWVEESVTELFGEDLSQLRALMAGPVREDPFQMLAEGEVPSLEALQLYNSTIYRWNRPCYGVSEGRAHLRIECRVLPAGPSTLDEVANAALWIGLVLGASEELGDPRERMDFREARSNFLAVARNGLATGVRWLDGTVVEVRSLILDMLLPMASRGLARADVDPDDASRYLQVIERRVKSGQTGSEWAYRSLTAMAGQGTRSGRLAALTAASFHRQQEGIPVDQWEPAELREAGGATQAYLRVEQYMHTHLMAVNEDESVDLVAFLMERERIQHVPVEDDEHRLVGVVSYRSILRYVGGQSELRLVGSTPVKEIMGRDPVTVTPKTSTLEAIRIMRDAGAACLPVLDEGKLVGIVTDRDFMPIAYELLRERLEPDA
jgi:CBS domain-containing protein